MDATSPHDLIMANRVTDTPVFNRAGDRMGHIDNLSIDKVSGQVVCAMLSFGGFLGIGDKLHARPGDGWSTTSRRAAMSCRSARNSWRARRRLAAKTRKT
jgi:hypothetical protein